MASTGGNGSGKKTKAPTANNTCTTKLTKVTSTITTTTTTVEKEEFAESNNVAKSSGANGAVSKKAAKITPDKKGANSEQSSTPKKKTDPKQNLDKSTSSQSSKSNTGKSAASLKTSTKPTEAKVDKNSTATKTANGKTTKNVNNVVTSAKVECTPSKKSENQVKDVPGPSPPKKEFKELHGFLKIIEKKKIIYDPSEAETNVAIMGKTKDALVQAMKEVDPLFCEIFQRTVYTGSYFDGVRITSPSEFDLNLVLRLPFDPSDVTISAAKDAPAFVHYQLKRKIEEIYAFHPKWLPTLYQKLPKFFDKNLYLQRNFIQTWVQGVIAKAVEKMKLESRIPPEVLELKSSQSGPAFTYYIVTSSGTIDVDFVPVIDGSQFPHPPGFRKTARFSSLDKPSQTFFLVPKPAKGASSCSSEAANYWRVSFPEAEKKLLCHSDLGCVKLLIKLLKLLRDSQDWKIIASYYIKTMILLEIDSQPNSEATKKFWKEENLGSLFVQMLGKLKQVINDRKLPYYFIGKNSNILSGLKESHAQNLSSRIDAIINKIIKNPASILGFMKCSNAL